MGIWTRQERIAVHKKQEVTEIKEGVPTVSELSEGVPTLRSTKEGLVEYIRYRGELYKTVLNKSNVSSDTKFSDDGYVVLSNGFILQWGQETAAATTEVVTFPIPFPNACLNIVATPYENSSNTGDDGAVTVSVLPTKTSVTFGSDAGWATIFWQAIGY